MLPNLTPRIHGASLASQGLTLPKTVAPVIRGSTDTSFPYSLPVARGPRQLDTGFSNYFEALTPSYDRSAIPLFIFALRSVMQSFNRVQLSFLARYLYDNDGLVSLAVDTIANYCAPVIPYSNTGNVEIDTVLNNYFSDWMRRADFTGRFDYPMLQRLLCKAIDTDGDILPTFTDEHGFPQIQILEGWRLDSRSLTDKTFYHIDGVGIDAKQCVTGYWTVNALNNFVVGLTPPEFISANVAKLLYDPDRYSAYRGMSPMRRGMNDIRDAKDLKGFEKIAAKMSAALAAVIKGKGFEEEDVWGNDTGDPTDPTSQGPTSGNSMHGNSPPPNPTQQEQKLSIAELLGGDIPILPMGTELQQLDNKRPGERTLQMLDYLGAYFVSGLGIPPAFIIQGSRTGPGERSVNGKAQRKFDKRQEILGGFSEWTWVRVIGNGIAKDGLPIAPGWDKPTLQGPAKISIDDGRDAASAREEVGSGLSNRRRHYAAKAQNWQTETDQGFEEDDYIIAKAEAISKARNVPIELILNRWGYAAAKPAPPASPEKEDPKDE